LVPIYQAAIDDIINKMGKSVVLHFVSTVTNVQTSFDDIVNPGDTRMPDYKETSSVPAPDVVENTKTIKALHSYAPKEWRQVAPHVNEAQSVLRLKTFLTDVPDLTRCQYIVPSSGSQNTIPSKFRLLKEAIPVGLQTDRYAITYWERC
jgi:hypothetical protein